MNGLLTMDISTLDSAARDSLAKLADTLIPGTDTFPAASAAGVCGELIDRVLRFRPDLSDDFHAALAHCSGKEPADAFDELVSTHPEQFDALSTLISGAYFQSPAVQTALNYQPAPRPAHDDVDAYVDLLEQVVERGFDIHQ